MRTPSYTLSLFEKIYAALSGDKFYLKPSARDVLVSCVVAMENGLAKRGVFLNEDEHVGLVKKLYDYCRCRKWSETDAVSQLKHVLPTFIDGIAAAPSLTTRLFDLGTLVDTREHNRRRARNMLARWPHDDTPRRIIAKSRDGKYTLEELLTPQHMLEETLALGHCMGTSMNPDVLAKKNVLDYDDRAPEGLHWWTRVHSNQNRLFSLRGEDEGTCASIGYEAPEKKNETGVIVEMEGESRILYGDEEFYPALCGAVGWLIDKLGVKRIDNGLPPPPNQWQTLLTRHNGWVTPAIGFEKYEPKDIIVGVASFSIIRPSAKRDAFVKCGRILPVEQHLDFMDRPPWVKSCNLPTGYFPHRMVPTRPERRLPTHRPSSAMVCVPEN
jgi:hypothetical protein